MKLTQPKSENTSIYPKFLNTTVPPEMIILSNSEPNFLNRTMEMFLFDLVLFNLILTNQF